MGGDGSWTGGDAILVQTGDITDRGDESGPIFRALFRLQDEAPRAGGQVILLMGNHELMNLESDFRYATKRDTASLGSGREEAFGPSGWIGQRLRERFQTVALVGPEVGLAQPILYVHAGLMPEISDELAKVEGTGAQKAQLLNSVVRDLLKGPAAEIRAEPSPLLGDAGPFWTRQLALDREDRICGDLERSLGAFSASRMVVGHTPQEDGKVHQRCGGRLVLADTLISAAYTGVSHPSAVEVAGDGTMTAVYPGTLQRSVLQTPPAAGAAQR